MYLDLILNHHLAKKNNKNSLKTVKKYCIHILQMRTHKIINKRNTSRKYKNTNKLAKGREIQTKLIND